MNFFQASVFWWFLGVVLIIRWFHVASYRDNDRDWPVRSVSEEERQNAFDSENRIVSGGHAA